MSKKVVIFTGLVSVDTNLVGTAVIYKKIADIFIKEGFQVTMALPQETDLKDNFINFKVYNEKNNKKIIDSAEVVIFGAYPPTDPLLYSYKKNKIIVTYLWSIAPVGSLEFKDFKSKKEQIKLHRFINSSYNLSLLLSDKIFCRDEGAKKLVLGSLISLGRLNLENYTEKRNFNNLLEVAPFGVDESVNRKNKKHFYRGVLDNVGKDDFLLIWNGGVWNWNDGATLIRAMKKIKNKKVKLIFQGFKHPDKNKGISFEAKKCFKLAQNLGLKDKNVFFNDTWIPYQDRINFLAESDAGVVCSPDIPEANLFLKTRIYDYFWADLPIILNECEAFASLIKEKELGFVCRTGDYNDWAKKIDILSQDGKILKKMKANIRKYKKEISWQKTLQPLKSFAKRPTKTRDNNDKLNDLVLSNISLNKSVVEKSK